MWDGHIHSRRRIFLTAETMQYTSTNKNTLRQTIRRQNIQPMRNENVIKLYKFTSTRRDAEKK